MTRPSFLYWDELCNELLGKVPPNNARKGAALKLVWLLSILRAPLPEEPTIHQLQYGYGNRVHLMYFNLLHDFDNIKKYSWGFAYLTNL